MSVFERGYVDRAWEVYYQLADHRTKAGLTIDELRQVIEAALVGVTPAVERFSPMRGSHRRFVSPWVEVEEHQ